VPSLTRNIVSLLSLSLLVGCVAKPIVFPVWCGNGYSGEGHSESNRADSYDKALAEAFKKLSRDFGVTVSSAVSKKEIERGDTAFVEATEISEMRSEQITVLEYKVLNRETKELSAGAFRTCIEINISAKERARIENRVNKLSVIRLSCIHATGEKSDCPSGLASQIKRGLTGAGYQFVQTGDYAFLFLLDVKTRLLSKVYGTEYYVAADVGLSVRNADTGDLLSLISVQDIEGSAYSERDAKEQAVRTAVESLIRTQLKSLRVGASR
jgi:hypothetical protein